MYGKKEGANGTIENMCFSKDATLRYGAMFMIGCAYAGSNSSYAI